MGQLILDYPDAVGPDMIRAIAPRMIDAPNLAIAAIATKVVSGQATSPAEKKALGEAWLKREAKAALLDYRGQLAAIRAREDATDPAVSW
jgi:hypothetical protein